MGTPSKLTALVVDDERLARNRLRRLLERIGVSVTGEAADGQAALDLVKSTPSDLLFIDINMPRKNGLQAAAEIAEHVDEAPAIIFCTAYDEFALRAFETNASAYLLKPVNDQDLARAIERARRLNRLQIDAIASNNVSPEDEVVLRRDGELEVVPMREVLFFRSIDKHVYAHIKGRGDNLIDFTLKELQQAHDATLVRTHRSVLVNRSHLTKLTRDDHGGMEIEIAHYERRLPVSRRHLAEVKKCFER